MSRLDVVIFGATGFTGKHAVIRMVKFAKEFSLTWAVAGRSEKKLQDVMAEVSQKAGADVSGIKLIVADVKDEASLNAMCAQCKVLVNCCGPYRLYGEPVVKAAIQNKTHYVDVSGEPQFMELMQLVYNDQARDAAVFVVSACGWDSIPNDLGVTYLLQNFTGPVNSVESYLSSHIPEQYSSEMKARGVVNYGTWESLVYGIANHHELPPLREKLYPKRKPFVTPRLERKLFHKRDGEWCLPFLGADESVVYRSQRYLHDHHQQRPAQFKAYFKVGSLLRAILLAAAGIFLYAMSKTNFTRTLLLKYPRLFSLGMISREGPADVVMNNTQFKFQLVGHGWQQEEEAHLTKPNKTLSVQVSGMNPGYGATVVAVLMSAITILKEQDKMPASGGVFTPGVAFKNTQLIKHLNENDLKFEVLNTN